MTVEVEYRNVNPSVASRSQLRMAEQIEANRGFPLEEITRIVAGNVFIIRVETDLPNTAVENMLSDIEEHLNPEAEHIETREVE